MRTPPHWLRCALRVSHPLNALLPLRPPELISSRSRPWGFPFKGSKTRSRTPSSDAATFMTFRLRAQQPEITSKPVCPVDCPNAAPSPSRLSTSDPVPPRAPGVSRLPERVPSWGFLPRGMLRITDRHPLQVASPPVLHRSASKLTARGHPRVSISVTLDRALSTSANLHEVWYLVIPSRICGGCDARGVLFTLRPPSASPPRDCPLYASSTAGRSSSRRPCR
jgi:hypothetical protein